MKRVAAETGGSTQARERELCQVLRDEDLDRG